MAQPFQLCPQLQPFQRELLTERKSTSGTTAFVDFCFLIFAFGWVFWTFFGGWRWKVVGSEVLVICL